MADLADPAWDHAFVVIRSDPRQMLPSAVVPSTAAKSGRSGDAAKAGWSLVDI
jgi:hypothetical protein